MDKFEEINFFKIPRFISNLDCSIDTLIIAKVYGYGKYRPGRTAPYRCIKLWMDAEMFLINNDKKFVICGWTFCGSQFLEINSVRIYKDQQNLDEFLYEKDRTCNAIIHNGEYILRGKTLTQWDKQFDGRILPNFYLTSKYDHDYTHLFLYEPINLINDVKIHLMHRVYHIGRFVFN